MHVLDITGKSLEYHRLEFDIILIYIKYLKVITTFLICLLTIILNTVIKCTGTTFVLMT